MNSWGPRIVDSRSTSRWHERVIDYVTDNDSPLETLCAVLAVGFLAVVVLLSLSVYFR